MSQATATNPLGRILLDSLLDDEIDDAVIVSSGVKDRVDLPASPENVLSRQEEVERIKQIAQGQVMGAPENYQVRANAESAEQRAAANYNYWRENYPSVNLKPADNPELDPFILRNAWTGPGLPPLVKVEIIPRSKPKPEKGFLASSFGQILGVVANIIPVVGTAVSLGLALGSSAQAKSYAAKWKASLSAFEPQYDPAP